MLSLWNHHRQINLQKANVYLSGELIALENFNYGEFLTFLILPGDNKLSLGADLSRRTQQRATSHSYGLAVTIIFKSSEVKLLQYLPLQEVVLATFCFLG